MSPVSALIRTLLLFSVTVFALEPALGEARDGTVHHEAAAAASTHSSAASGDHGHEDEGQDHQHGSDHRHGTIQDHCAHLHAMDVVAPATMPFIDNRTESSSIVAPSSHTGSSLPPPGQPPRA